MKYLIIPAAGSQSRFKINRPKWLLTLPSGQLIIQEIIENLLIQNSFDKILLGVKPEDTNININIFNDLVMPVDVEIVPVINSKSPIDTIVQIVDKFSGTIVDGDTIFIKDSDSIFSIDRLEMNSVVYDDVTNNTFNVPEKSFLEVDQHGFIKRIVEKKIVSPHFSIGGYYFDERTAEDFVYASKTCTSDVIGHEVFVSHVIENMMMHGHVFRALKGGNYLDIGTQEAWDKYLSTHKTILCDIDGVIVENQSKYFEDRWGSKPTPIWENINRMLEFHNSGSVIYFVTSRPEKYREHTEDFLNEFGFRTYKLIMGMPHSPRMLINDYTASNPFPTAEAINIERGGTIPI